MVRLLLILLCVPTVACASAQPRGAKPGVARIGQKIASAYARTRGSKAVPPGPLADATRALGSAPLAATYLEVNCWLLSLGGVTVLVDPLLEGSLDFGLPDGVYSASKRVLPKRGLVGDLPPLDVILITQGLDDHAHNPTLAALAAVGCTAPIYAPPSARDTVLKHFDESQVTFMSPGASTVVRAGKGSAMQIRATSGALVGPPWQARENGYVLRDASTGFSVYYEPHVEFNSAELAALAPVDVVITPVEGQGLPPFSLVHDSATAANLVKVLRPRWVLPMANGAVDATGLTAPLVQTLGSPDEFERLISEASLETTVAEVRPGQPTLIQ